MTTLFWVGETSSAENNFIPNHESNWDKDWQGVTAALMTLKSEMVIGQHRSDPRKIPSTCAPLWEFTDSNNLKISARRIPWYRVGLSPLLKNRWIEIRWNELSCFAQWQDVGPCGEMTSTS
jgi:hypothetical protein